MNEENGNMSVNKHSSSRKLYKLSWVGYCSVEGLFTAHPEDIDLIMGEEIYFGAICGKHSEVFFTITEDDLTEIPVPVGEIEAVHGNIRDRWTPFDSYTISGYNPLYYYEHE